MRQRREHVAHVAVGHRGQDRPARREVLVRLVRDQARAAARRAGRAWEGTAGRRERISASVSRWRSSPWLRTKSCDAEVPAARDSKGLGRTTGNGQAQELAVPAALAGNHALSVRRPRVQIHVAARGDGPQISSRGVYQSDPGAGVALVPNPELYGYRVAIRRPERVECAVGSTQFRVGPPWPSPDGAHGCALGGSNVEVGRPCKRVRRPPHEKDFGIGLEVFGSQRRFVAVGHEPRRPSSDQEKKEQRDRPDEDDAVTHRRTIRTRGIPCGTGAVLRRGCRADNPSSPGGRESGTPKAGPARSPSPRVGEHLQVRGAAFARFCVREPWVPHHLRGCRRSRIPRDAPAGSRASSSRRRARVAQRPRRSGRGGRPVAEEARGRRAPSRPAGARRRDRRNPGSAGDLASASTWARARVSQRVGHDHVPAGTARGAARAQPRGSRCPLRRCTGRSRRATSGVPPTRTREPRPGTPRRDVSRARPDPRAAARPRA